jgi:hypothetical protein
MRFQEHEGRLDHTRGGLAGGFGGGSVPPRRRLDNELIDLLTWLHVIVNTLAIERDIRGHPALTGRQHPSRPQRFVSPGRATTQPTAATEVTARCTRTPDQDAPCVSPAGATWTSLASRPRQRRRSSRPPVATRCRSMRRILGRGVAGCRATGPRQRPGGGPHRCPLRRAHELTVLRRHGGVSEQLHLLTLTTKLTNEAAIPPPAGRAGYVHTSSPGSPGGTAAGAAHRRRVLTWS